MIFQEELRNSFLVNAQRTAIEADGVSLTYAQLKTRSDAVTAYLLEQGMVDQEVIGVYLEDRLDIVIAMIGIMNAGCVFVPLDTSLPQRRLSMILNDLNPECIVSGLQNPVPDSSISVVALQTIATSQQHASDLIYPRVDKDDSIYIYYTSGSTGTPKGIVGKNESLKQFVRWEIDAFSIDGGDRVSQLTSPYFDAFLRDVFVPLFAGATLCIPSAKDDFFTVDNLSHWIDSQRITLIHCVPTVFRVILSEIPSGDAFQSLKRVLLSGERIIPSELKDWYRHFNDRVSLVNLYGPTETTMIRFYYPIQPSDVSLQRIPIGQPISNGSFLIADKGLTPCKMLVPGELYILSQYGTKGYLNAPDSTAEKFFTIENDDGDLLPAFKTGDNAKLLANGQVDLLGRQDRQVKIRGIRIELDEIENVAMRSELVKNAAAVKQEEQNGNEALTLFVVEKEQACDGKLQAKAWLEQQLPAYMMPSALIAVDAFPKLPNGKIDYRALSAMQPAASVVAPKNEVEEKLLVIWREILGNKPISIDENFISVGGNSLSVMRLIARIYKEFQSRVTLADIFSNLTIAEQAKLLEKSSRNNLYVIPQARVQPSYPLSMVQERMYFNYELDMSSTVYNMPLAWEIIGPVDSEKLRTAFVALTDRHVSLRTAFRFEDGSLKQVICSSYDFVLEEKQLNAGSTDEAVADFVRPFDLGKAPLIRAGVLTLSTGRRILAVDTHHICCDGISQSILLSDFLRLYNGEKLKPLAIQYPDYAVWERGFRKTEEYKAHRQFWLQSFEGEVPVIEWPNSNGRPDEDFGNNAVTRPDNDGGNLRWTADPILVDKLTRQWAEWNLTPFSGFFAIHLLFLAHWTEQEDLVVGINTSGRLQDELEGVTGMFAKTVPIRTKIDRSLSIKNFVQQIHRQVAEAGSRQLYDLADIVACLNAGRKSPINTLFDTVFVFQNFVFDGSNEQFNKLALKKRMAKYPLTFFVTEVAAGVHFDVEYATHFWQAGSIQQLIEQYAKFLSTFGDNIDGTIGVCIGKEHAVELAPDENIVFKF